MTDAQIYPGTFAQAIRDPEIKPGDRLLLHEGTYTGDFDITLIDVVILPVAGERVIINGKLDVHGSDVTLQGLEITYSSWASRETSTAGSSPPDIPTDKGIAVYGPRTKLINCVIHNSVSGVFVWNPAWGTEIYGCLIFNGGWKGPDRGHGHATYSQNNHAIPRVYENNIFFNMFADNLTALYGDQEVSKYTITGNTLFGGVYALLGGDEGIDIQNNYLYNIGASLTSNADYSTVRDVIVKNNYLVSLTADRHTLAVDGWLNVDIENNTIVGIGATSDNPLLVNFQEANGDTVAWNNNTYYHNLPVNPFGSGAGYKTFAQWQALGYDAGGTLTNTAPATNQVFVRPNAYKVGANITIYNWQGLDSVDVSLSSVTGLSAGDSYRLISVQDYFNDVATGTVAENRTISVDMRSASHIVAKPIGWTGDWYANTFPQFGAFVLEKVA